VQGSRSGHTTVSTLEIDKVVKSDGLSKWENINCSGAFTFPHKGVLFIVCEEKEKPESNNLIVVALSTIVSD